MLGDVEDFVGRLKRVLPTGWFGNVSPFSEGVLRGIAAAWSAIYTLVAAVRTQARLGTASGIFLESVSADFFGGNVPRRMAESDDAFRHRLGLEMLRPRGTRSALQVALTDLTGEPVSVFEPMRSMDTGGYNLGGVGYGVAGGWGNLALPYQTFVVARRPLGAGIALLAGYGTGGVPVYGDADMMATQVPDADIYAAAAAIVPAGYVVWLRIVS